MTAASPERGTSAASRFRRFLKRTFRPAAGRLQMAEAAIFFGLKPAARSTHLPHFLGIGGQKCGTTWLDYMLRFHPQIGLPRRKEIHFFDGNFWRGLDWYRLHYRGLGGTIRGEVTPSYSILPVERIREVHSVNPAMRLVLIMRHPVERAWSQIEMGLVRNRRRTIAEVPDAEFLRQVENAGVLARSSYSLMLQHWLEVFPADQLHLEFFESIATEPRPLLTRILTHVGADPARTPWERMPLGQKINANAGRDIPEPCRTRLRELLADEITALHQILPRPEVLNWR